MNSFFLLTPAKKILLLFIALQGLTASAQNDTLNFPPPSVPVSVYASEARESINVDGKLSESSWQTASVISDFFRMEPRQGGAYLHQTFVRILFDKSNIYFGVFCRDRMGKNGVWVQDIGIQRDMQVFEDASKDGDWDALRKVRTHITDSGYYAEFAIPFRTCV